MLLKQAGHMFQISRMAKKEEIFLPLQISKKLNTGTICSMAFVWLSICVMQVHHTIKVSSV